MGSDAKGELAVHFLPQFSSIQLFSHVLLFVAHGLKYARLPPVHWLMKIALLSRDEILNCTEM